MKGIVMVDIMNNVGAFFAIICMFGFFFLMADTPQDTDLVPDEVLANLLEEVKIRLRQVKEPITYQVLRGVFDSLEREDAIIKQKAALKNIK
jgi:hypothetical protein